MATSKLSPGRAVSELRPNVKNPRNATDKKLRMLKRSVEKLGDISGVVFNRRTSQLVGGHQRTKVLPAGAKVELVEVYDEPTSAGTTALGYITIGKERHGYREVDWDEHTEMVANLAANKGAGEWVDELLKDALGELVVAGVDLEATMFDQGEVDKLLGKLTEPKDEEDLAIEEGYKILIECEDEAQQGELLQQLQDQGVKCKPLIS